MSSPDRRRNPSIFRVKFGDWCIRVGMGCRGIYLWSISGYTKREIYKTDKDFRPSLAENSLTAKKPKNFKRHFSLINTTGVLPYATTTKALAIILY